MSMGVLKREVGKLLDTFRRRTCPESSLLQELRADPSRILGRAGLAPDPWQEALLRSPSPRILMNITRQGGKSLTASALALRDALLRPDALVLLLSPTQRQSGELFKSKIKYLYNRLGRPVRTVQESALTLELENGSRILSLPGDEGTVRGYSRVTTLIVDEASRVPDSLYYSVRPMLATSGGRLVCLSTPWGKRGFFHSEWEGGKTPWRRVRVTAPECPRIPPQFLAEELAALGERWYRQEYMCSFEETLDAVFAYVDIMASLQAGVKPLEFPA